MTLLAIDLGTTTGWATCNEGIIRSGRQIFRVDRFAGGGARYLAFKRWIVNTLFDEKISEVVFEKVHRHAGTAAAHVYGGLSAILMAECERIQIPYQGYDVGTIKKFWTGKGNASKDLMVSEAVKRGFNPADDNEADALAMVHLWADESTLITLEDLL